MDWLSLEMTQKYLNFADLNAINILRQNIILVNANGQKYILSIIGL
jgi:hypothetical protein